MREFANPDRLRRAIAKIASDRRSGASELANEVLKAFMSARPREGVAVGRYARAVRVVARSLRDARTAMAPIAGVAERVVFEFERVAAGYDAAPDAFGALRDIAHGLSEDLASAGNEVSRRFGTRFGRFSSPLVISYSSQVVRALRELRRPRVTVCESRPMMEGRRTAKLLQPFAASVDVITEAQMAMAIERCDSVVLGCDAIYPDGSVVNKTGTRLLALVARSKRRPAIVLGDTYKLRIAQRHEAERQPDTQVWAHAPDGIGVRNVTFERVPSDLISYIVLETGVYRTGQIGAVWRRAKKSRAVL